jgi:hypothetical protein
MNEYIRNLKKNTAILATKEDLANVKSDLQKTIYLASLGQLFAIVASVVSLILVHN